MSGQQTQSPCAHNKTHRAEVTVNYLEDKHRFVADVRIFCADCGHPFQFMGLPLGLDMSGATMSIDGQEARLAIVPVGQIPAPINGVSGFGVRAP